MNFWFSSVANITERNLIGLDLVALLELELASYCFELKPFCVAYTKCKATLCHHLIYLFLYLSMPCIRLACGKFELTNQDSVGGKNSSVLM